jgi:hypothetical protein
MQMTEKEDDKVGEDFVQAWRIMDEVIGSILRENPNLNPGRKRDQDVIARLLSEKVKNDDRLTTAMATATVGHHILERKTKHYPKKCYRRPPRLRPGGRCVARRGW